MNFKEYRSTKTVTPIDEQLLPNEETKADRMVSSGHSFYRSEFLSHNPKAKEAFEKSNEPKRYSIRTPVTLTESSSAPHPEVKDFLIHHNYKIHDDEYRSGLATEVKKVGDPERGIPLRDKIVQHKIGGLLEKHNAPDSTKKAYMNDPFRTGARNSNYDIILTGHHHDVFGMSTGRGWTSCANLRASEDTRFRGNGPAAKDMGNEINNHTHVAYLVPRGGNVDTDAIARTAFKHHRGLTTGHQTLLPENSVYGSAPSGFLNSAKKIVSNLFDKKDDIYKKTEGVYSDNSKTMDFPKNPSSHLIDTAWKSIPKKDDNTRYRMYSHIDPDQKYKSTELSSVGKHIKSIRDAANSGNFHDTMDAVSTAGWNIAERGHYHLTGGENPHVDAAMDKGVQSFNIHDPDHVKKLINYADRTNQITRAFVGRVSRSIPPAKTTDEFHTLSHLKKNGVQLVGDSWKVPIDPKHTMGKNPHDAIVKSLSDRGELNHANYSESFLSTKNARSGNLYDHAVHHENEGIPGMTDIIHALGNRIKDSARTNSYAKWTTDDEIAHTFHCMKPATRDRFGDAMGIDHKKLRKQNPAKINDHKEMWKQIKEAQKNKVQDGE